MEVFPGTQLTRNIEMRMRLTMIHLVRMAIIPNRMNFRKSSKGGGGFIFNPKFYIADFGNFE